MRTPMLPGPSTITLDQESFKALASGVRVDILKRLDERRQTVTDLSALLALSKPTLLEHLEKLQAADLVRRVDEGRKWIYYELSAKGRKILHPERVAIVLALASAVVLAAVGVFLLLHAGAGGLIGAPSATPANYTAGPQGSNASPSGLGASIAGGLVASGLAVAAGAAALVLFWLGRRRRERFFSQLPAP